MLVVAARNTACRGGWLDAPVPSSGHTQTWYGVGRRLLSWTGQGATRKR